MPYNTILRRTWDGLQMLWDFLKSLGVLQTQQEVFSMPRLSIFAPDFFEKEDGDKQK